MRRLTLRLPETLFHRLELLADSEGISLNQYLVYSLTQSVARSYRVLPVPQAELERQHAHFDEMIASLGVASDEEFEAILAEGEWDERGTGLDPAVVARVEEKIAAARQS
jgi:hypothetical protein